MVVEVWLEDPRLVDDTREAELRALLDSGETARADRFHVQADRRAFVAAHALLRRTLSRFASVAPHDWRFGAGEFGKPQFVPDQMSANLAFNLSHARDLVAVAVAQVSHLGVDIESTQREVEDGVARMVLTPREYALWTSEGASPERFYEWWTCKEAVVKALGLGFSMPVDRLAIDLAGPRVRVLPSTVEEVPPLQLALVAPTPAHRLAVAAATDEPLELALHREGE